MAIYKRYRVEQKYIDGIPQEEYRLGEIYDDTPYHSLETCEEGHECILEYRWIDVEGEVICEGEASYHKQKRQQKCRNEEEWVDVYPQEFQKGELISEHAAECGGDNFKLVIEPNENGYITGDYGQGVYPYGATGTLVAYPNDPNKYEFKAFKYGSTSAYGSELFSNAFPFTMISDLYIAAIFSRISSSMPSWCQLYYSYIDDTESCYTWDSSTITSNWFSGSHATIIRDLSGILTSTTSYGFCKASNLKEIDFPNISYISKGTFENCGLEKVNLPNVEYIGDGAFYGCDWLQSIDMPKLTYIGAGAFNNCKMSLSNVNIPNVEYIGDAAFWTCGKLQSIDMPIVSEIGADAFGGCEELSVVNAPKVDIIRHSTFVLCHKLTNVNIPNVTSIGYDAFWACYELSSISLPLVSTIGQSAFGDCGLLNVDFPLLERVYESAFAHCSRLSTVNLPLVTFMGKYTFQWCVNLESISIPEVREISAYTFDGCTKLSSINLPSVSVLGTYAFRDCDKLMDVYLGSSMVVRIVPSANSTLTHNNFLNCNSNIRIHIPASLCDDYNVRYGSHWVSLSGTTRKFSELFVCDIRPEEVNYYLHLSTEGMGSLSVVPSKAAYSHDDTLYITPIPNTDYSFAYYNYGVTSSYESGIESNSVFYLGYFVTDWWIKAVFSYVTPPPPVPPTPPSSGYITYVYSNGVTSDFYHNTAILSSADYNGSNASVIIDNAGVITTLPNNAFYKVKYLTEVSFPNVVSVGTYCFDQASMLSKVYMPQAEQIGTFAFGYTTFSSIDLPQGKSFGTECFYNNENLTEINLPNASWLGEECFGDCYNLHDVYLGSRSVVVFALPSNVFGKCDRGLSIHIPASLCEAYNSAYGSISVALGSSYPYTRRYFSEIFVSDL